MSEQNATIGKKFKPKEKFSIREAIAGLNPFNLILWSKTFSQLSRFIIIGAICFGLIFGIGYWRGIRNKPVILGYKNFVAYITDNSEEHQIEVKDGKLYFDGKIVKVSNVSQLRPYGIRVRPKVFFGSGSDLEGEVGIGAEIAHYFKLNLDVFGTNKALYGGISYDLELGNLLQNSSTGLAIGKSWDLEDTRLLWYWSLKF